MDADEDDLCLECGQDQNNHDPDCSQWEYDPDEAENTLDTLEKRLQHIMGKPKQ